MSKILIAIATAITHNILLTAHYFMNYFKSQVWSLMGIAIELKIGKFKPEYAGKMNFYLSALNDKEKLKDENPSIGIIICKDKKRTTVEYALKDSNQPIGIATYTLTENLPKDFQDYLPTPQDIGAKIESMLECVIDE